MRRSSLALVMIGLLIGSTATLALTRQSSSQREILACTNKASGKVRLTVTGTCDPVRESESPVSDLWSLQPAPPTSQTAVESTTTVARQLTKHVVDSNGKDLGVLISNDGFQSFWVEYQGGRFNITAGGSAWGEGWAGDPVMFSERTCQIPFINPVDSAELRSLRAVVDIPPPGVPSNKTTRKAFRPVGDLIATPKKLYRYNSPRAAAYWANYYQSKSDSDPSYSIDPNALWMTKAGCLKLSMSEFERNMSGGLPPRLYKADRVALPVFTSPLMIIEK